MTMAEHMILGKTKHACFPSGKSIAKRTPYHVFGRVFVMPVEGSKCESCDWNPRFKYFEIYDSISYIGFADDFGPMNMASIFQFSEQLDSQLDQYTCDLAMVTRNDPKTMTNAVFLLGSYLIMRLNYDLAETVACFEEVMPFTVPYRDVSPGPQNFQLYIQDCWAGLLRGKQLG